MRYALVIILTLVVVIVGIAYAANSVSDVRTITVVVQPGDTAWQLCAAHNDKSIDLRKAVWYFKQINGTVQLKPYDTVKVPVL